MKEPILNCRDHYPLNGKEAGIRIQHMKDRWVMVCTAVMTWPLPWILEKDLIAVVLPDGRETSFSLLLSDGDSDYNRPEKLTLTSRGGSYELLDHKKQQTYIFEEVAPGVFKPSRLFDSAGFTISFFYNAAGTLVKMIDSVGRDILLSLDEYSRVTEINALHRGIKRLLVTYGYNEAGDLCSISDALGKTTSIVYRNHLMVKKTDRNGQSFFWEYDGFSTGARCIHTWGDGGLLEGRIAYFTGYNEVTNSLGETSVYHYNKLNLCTRCYRSAGWCGGICVHAAYGAVPPGG